MSEMEIFFERRKQGRIDHPSDDKEKHNRDEKQDRLEVGTDAHNQGLVRYKLRTATIHLHSFLLFNISLPNSVDINCPVRPPGHHHLKTSYIELLNENCS